MCGTRPDMPCASCKPLGYSGPVAPEKTPARAPQRHVGKAGRKNAFEYVGRLTARYGEAPQQRRHFAPSASAKLAVSITLPRVTLVKSANTTSVRWMPWAVSQAMASLALEMEEFMRKWGLLGCGRVASQDIEPADLRKVAVMRDQGRSAHVQRRGQLQGVRQLQAVLRAQ